MYLVWPPMGLLPIIPVISTCYRTHMSYEQLEVSGIHASSPEYKEIQPCRSLNSLSGFFFFFNRDLRFQNFGGKKSASCS